MRGTLYGIGVGPGDPELMTLKAVRVIKACEVLLLPASSADQCYAYTIAESMISETAQKKIICVDFPMTKDSDILEAAHQQAFCAALGELQAGRSVAFLTIGDPAVYSTYMYLQKKIKAAGYEAEMIAGVTSFCAAAAALGISLGEKGDEIHIVPGSYDVAEALTYPGTKIFMKSGRQLSKLIHHLEGALPDRYEICGVSNCGMAGEVIFKQLSDIHQDAGYLTIVIVKDAAGGK